MLAQWTGFDVLALKGALIDYWPWLAAAGVVSCWVVIERAAARWRIGRVAARLGARVRRARGALYPVLEWNDGARRAQLAFPRTRGGATLRSTVCAVQWDGLIRFTVEVRRRGVLGQAALWLPPRRGEVRTGVKRFDQLFVVRSADPAAARRWLDREVQRSCVRLARASGGSAFRLVCDGGTLVARLGGAVTGRPELRLFAESVVWLARTMEAAAWDSQVQFAPVARARGESASSIHAPTCPTCAEPAGMRSAAICPVCRAAHHPACWDFLGGCGVYGCAGARNRHPGSSPTAA